MNFWMIDSMSWFVISNERATKWKRKLSCEMPSFICRGLDKSIMCSIVNSLSYSWSRNHSFSASPGKLIISPAAVERYFWTKMKDEMSPKSADYGHDHTQLSRTNSSEGASMRSFTTNLVKVGRAWVIRVKIVVLVACVCTCERVPERSRKAFFVAL